MYVEEKVSMDKYSTLVSALKCWTSISKQQTILDIVDIIPAGERFHIAKPDDGGGGVAQGLALQAERLARLLLVEALQRAGFGGEHWRKFTGGATVASQAVVVAATTTAAVCS